MNAPHEQHVGMDTGETPISGPESSPEGATQRSESPLGELPARIGEWARSVQKDFAAAGSLENWTRQHPWISISAALTTGVVAAAACKGLAGALLENEAEPDPSRRVIDGRVLHGEDRPAAPSMAERVLSMVPKEALETAGNYAASMLYSLSRSLPASIPGAAALHSAADALAHSAQSGHDT